MIRFIVIGLFLLLYNPLCIAITECHHMTEGDLHKINLNLDSAILNASDMPFLKHAGSGRFDSTLAMNLNYSPVVSLRNSIAQHLGRELTFFKAWLPLGEAHITVINPVEFVDQLSAYISIERINQIATEENIQLSKFEILGIGSGRLSINDKVEETFFLIVKSDELMRIRKRIFSEFCAAGGSPSDWNPNTWYPHITIGFTIRDFHDSDGIIKTLDLSLDRRFHLIVSDKSKQP